MKRIIALILLFTVALTATGCKPLVDDQDIPESFTVYASFYPIYALAALIIDEDIPGFTLHQLVQPQDGCLRDYTLSDWDAYLINSAADAVIWGGGGLESFAQAFYDLGENGPAVISAMSALVLKSGEQSEDSEAEGHFNGVNPWLFLSVDGAEQITEAICANMLALDEPYAELYYKNMEDAYERFQALRSEMAEIMSACDRGARVALMQEGLIYFADEWDLNVVCTIEHESGVDESDQMLAIALNQLSDCQVQAVFLEKQAPQALTEALEAAGYRVARIDTLATGREDEGAEGYFTKMRDNAHQAASALAGLGE